MKRLSWFCCTTCLLLAGCASLGSREPPPRTIVAPPASSVEPYLDLMRTLAIGDPARQSDAFYEVEKNYTQAPTTMNTLRYALALAIPGHPAFNPTQGKTLLEQLLARPELLSGGEFSLANIMLNDVDAWLKMQTENRRLTATVDERTRAQANSERRAQTQAEETARLRKELDAAQQKLDAIKDIERSIIERSTTSPGVQSGTKSNRDAPAQTQSTAPGR